MYFKFHGYGIHTIHLISIVRVFLELIFKKSCRIRHPDHIDIHGRMDALPRLIIHLLLFLNSLIQYIVSGYRSAASYYPVWNVGIIPPPPF